MLRWVVVFVALGACVDIPPYAVLRGVTWTDSNNGGTITSAVLTLHFAEGDKLHLPDDLRFTNGDRLIGASQNVACSDEDQLGVALYPESRMAADTPAGFYGTNDLHAALLGPAVVKVEISWGASFMCGATTRAPNGYTAYTMFPDGTITRYDELSEDSPPSVDASACTCGSPSMPMWAVTSFWTFNRMHLNNVEYGGVAHALPDQASGMQLQDKIVCVDDGQYSLTLSTMNATTRVTAPAPDTFALVHDTRYFATPTLADLQPLTDHVQTAMFVDPQHACAATGAAPVAFGANERLTINGTPLQRAVDGIFGGLDRGGTAGFPIAGAATLQGPVSLPYAVWLQFADDTDSITVADADKSASDPSWYVPQQVDSRSWVIWFRDALPLGETITVTAR